jgi:tripartite-type tricarboxylate transporter receptor subunit TctC
MNHFNTVPADGYTVAVPACQSNWVTAEIWYPNAVKYNAMEFEPVANIARSPLAFFAKPNSTVNTPDELIRDIKAKKRPITFAIGGGGHKLAVEYLVEHLKVQGSDEVITAMYKGPAQALLDVMGGHAEFGVTPIAVGWPHVQSGKLKLIGIANETSIKGLEKYPLMKNYVSGLNIHGCWNMVLPKGTPADVQAWYRDNFVPLINSKESEKKFADNMMFVTPVEQTPEGVRASMVRLRKVWQPIAQKIKP